MVLRVSINSASMSRLLCWCVVMSRTRLLAFLSSLDSRFSLKSRMSSLSAATSHSSWRSLARSASTSNCAGPLPEVVTRDAAGPLGAALVVLPPCAAELTVAASLRAAASTVPDSALDGSSNSVTEHQDALGV
eukprot:TRINITY_DN18390_c0_g1_i4.p1 TRINITY_DN18390_c0_g1~~TRINITY_DN18390_c0_g1_i4.p1  ORF type:complete len:133 (+),score=7.00 TRINITY_DN18390_c0_g1_i4:314-712(+)